MSTEAILVISAALLLFSLTTFEAYARNAQADLLGDAYQKSIVCRRIADSAVLAYTGGPGASVDLALPYRFNISVWGKEGIILVGDDPDSISCNMPWGVTNASGAFNVAFMNMTNVAGWVVIKGV